MKQSHADALEAAVFAGSILLESGAEIFRVEDTVLRIAKAYGVQSCNTFTLSSGFFTTAGGVNEEYFAKVRYIPLSAARLDKVEAVNQLSREIVEGQHTVEEAYHKLQEIADMPKYPRVLRLAATAVGCASFCCMFGGSLLDCLASSFAGFLLYTFITAIETRKLSKITVNIAGGAIATLASMLLVLLGLGNNLSQVIIGAIIPLVPGVPFTNAIRDMAGGDYIAGSVRLLDALLIAFCIAGGVGVVYALRFSLLGGIVL
ncbi:MAG: threonine/serine exporter family protein [Angelakisella sp.]